METEKNTVLLPTPDAAAPQAGAGQTILSKSSSAPSLSQSPAAAQILDKTVQGSVLVLIQFDVSEEIRLDELRNIFGARRQEASFKHPAPGYVRYQRPPVVEKVDPLVLESGERLDAQIKYYDYGVLSVVFELPFSGDWDTLVRLAGRWVWDTDFTSFAQKIVKGFRILEIVKHLRKDCENIVGDRIYRRCQPIKNSGGVRVAFFARIIVRFLPPPCGLRFKMSTEFFSNFLNRSFCHSVALRSEGNAT